MACIDKIKPILHRTFVAGHQGWWECDARNDTTKHMQHSPTGLAELVETDNDYLQAVADKSLHPVWPPDRLHLE